MNIVRTLTVFLALAALSFVLGFFVLARLIPGSSRSGASAILPSAPGSQPGEDATVADGARPAVNSEAAPSRIPPVASEAAVTAPPVRTPGPTLDPSTDAPLATDPTGVQKPRKVDESAKEQASAAPDAGTSGSDTDSPKARIVAHLIAAKPKRRHRASVRNIEAAPAAVAADEHAAGDDESVTTDREDAPVPRTHRPRRVRVAHTTNEQESTTTESDDAERPVRTRRADSETSGGALFHVRLGAYHSREAADHEVQRARTKGFATRVVPIQQHGHVLYRVQVGAFRQRNRAESIRQSLEDASLAATVTEQRH